MKTIFWASDSTVSNKRITEYPEMGIGQVFDYYLREGVHVENHAMNGRSTKSFIDEGRLTAMARRIRLGDFMFIQFGHNDEKIDNPVRYASPTGGFPENLRKFIAVARERQATPVIISPMVRRIFTPDGALGPQTHAAYAATAAEVAAEQGVAFVDLFQVSGDLLVAAGPKSTKNLFLHLAPGQYYNYPDGLADNTHLRLPGAMLFGKLIADDLKKLGGEYAELITDYE